MLQAINSTSISSAAKTISVAARPCTKLSRVHSCGSPPSPGGCLALRLPRRSHVQHLPVQGAFFERASFWGGGSGYVSATRVTPCLPSLPAGSRPSLTPMPQLAAALAEQCITASTFPASSRGRHAAGLHVWRASWTCQAVATGCQAIAWIQSAPEGEQSPGASAINRLRKGTHPQSLRRPA